MTFQEIEAERARVGISQYRLCRRADLHQSTYHRLLKGQSAARPRTLARLRRALEALAAEREAEAA